VNTAGLEGKLSKSATIYSNDPENKSVRLSLTGEVKPYISVKPRRFVYLTAKENETELRKLQISAADDEKFKILDIKSTLGEDVVKYDLKEIEPGKTYELTVQTAGAKVGRYGGDIELTTDNPVKSKVNIRVNVDIRGEIMTIPQFVSFGNVDSQRLPKVTFKRRILVKRENNKEFNLTHAKYDEKKYEVELKKPSNGQGYEVVITLHPENFPKGPYRDEILLKTDVESQPIVKIPIAAKFM